MKYINPTHDKTTYSRLLTAKTKNPIPMIMTGTVIAMSIMATVLPAQYRPPCILQPRSCHKQQQHDVMVGGYLGEKCYCGYMVMWL